MSDSVLPHRRQPTRLPCPWDSPGKNTGVGCHFLFQCTKVKSESEVAQSCPTLIDPMDCSLPGSSAHGIFQARVLEWGAINEFPSVNKFQLYACVCVRERDASRGRLVMELITSEEARNRVDQLMNDESRVCRAVTLTFKLLSLAPMVYHKASPGDTFRERALQNPFCRNQGKANIWIFRMCVPMSIVWKF